MKKILCLTAVLLIAVALWGCSVIETPEQTDFGWSLYGENREKGVAMEEFTQNTDYEYVRCRYNAYLPEENENGTWVYPTFLTSESEPMERVGKYEQRIESMEQLSKVVAAIESNRSYNESKDEGVYFKLKYDGIPYEIDEEFFLEHHLYVVEFCFEGNPDLRSRLDEVAVDGKAVSIAISYETTHAWTGDFPGEVYFIVIPADAESVDVTLTETAWER